jgi:low molecular weight protein-tyrosine phosphatase
MHNKKILFVCLGNICRSPAAEAILKKRLRDENLQDIIYVDSAGTAGYHVDESPDPRMIGYAAKRGYTIEHTTRKFNPVKDFSEFDYIITMDNENFNDVKSHDNLNKYSHKLFKMAEFCKNSKIDEVPDPYYEGKKGFNNVLDILEDGCTGIMEKIKNANHL